MKQSLLFTLVLFLSVQLFAQFKPFTIDETLTEKIKKAKSASLFKNMPGDNSFMFFVDSLQTGRGMNVGNVRHFLDTLTRLADIPCDCMIKNDTAYLQGGIAYGAGMGFDVRITKKNFNGKLWFSGKRMKTEQMSDYPDEVVLNSRDQTLSIQSIKSLAKGKTLIGELFLETETFTKKSDTRPNRIYMKLLFSCKLDDYIAF